MPPKRRTGGPSSPQNRRPKIAGSARSLNVPAGTSDSDPVEPTIEQPEEETQEAVKPEVAKPTLTKAESGDIEPPKTETDAPESTPGPDLTKPAKTVADEPKAPATPETRGGVGDDTYTIQGRLAPGRDPGGRSGHRRDPRRHRLLQSRREDGRHRLGGRRRHG